MTTAEPPAAPRRRAQKSARARQVICEATIECLVQVGYSETSISRVVETAGVSKGALQHHFPTREDLMCATARYLLERPLRYADRLRSSGGRDARGELRELWTRMTNTDPFRALLEIVLAARTDALLHRRIAAELREAIERIDRHFARRYGDLGEAQQEELRRLMCANRCFLCGLLIEEQYGIGRREQQAVLEVWLDMVVPRLDRLYHATPAGSGREGEPE